MQSLIFQKRRNYLSVKLEKIILQLPFNIPNIPYNIMCGLSISLCDWILNHLHGCNRELNNLLENNIILLIINHFNYFMLNPYLPRTMFSWKSSLTMLPIFDVLTYNNNNKKSEPVEFYQIIIKTRNHNT